MDLTPDYTSIQANIPPRDQSQALAKLLIDNFNQDVSKSWLQNLRFRMTHIKKINPRKKAYKFSGTWDSERGESEIPYFAWEELEDVETNEYDDLLNSLITHYLSKYVTVKALYLYLDDTWAVLGYPNLPGF